MKLNTAAVIALITALFGIVGHYPLIWIPLSVFIAAILDLFTRTWVMSDRLGRARTLSILLKFIFSLIGFYAMLGQIACLGLIVWWLF